MLWRRGDAATRLVLSKVVEYAEKHGNHMRKTSDVRALIGKKYFWTHFDFENMVWTGSDQINMQA